MDQLSRNEDLLESLGKSDWDLVVVDEAHRMSATTSATSSRRHQSVRSGTTEWGRVTTSGLARLRKVVTGAGPGQPRT